MYEALELPERNGGSGPSFWDTATELPRVMVEMTALAYTWPLLASAPRGDGHAVFVLPGFTAGDASTLPLRRLLKLLGYEPLPWELGQNTGSVELQERLFQRFEALIEERSGAISLVGQSLGGVFARVLAHRWPERIRAVVTLGSPFASTDPDTVNAMVSRLFQAVSGMSRDEMREQMLDFPSGPPPVPTSAIYSRSDGVVHWSSCLEATGPQAENIEILGSHSGMAFNPLVLNVIADRLSQPENRWRPFRRSGCRSIIYPRPVDAKTANGDAP